MPRGDLKLEFILKEVMVGRNTRRQITTAMSSEGYCLSVRIESRQCSLTEGMNERVCLSD